MDILNKIICGDSREVLKNIPDKSIHMIITSPPYNVGMPYSVGDRNPYYDYLKLLEDVFRECYRILIPGGRIAVNCPSSILQSTKSRMAYLSIDILLMLRNLKFLDREMVTWIKAPYGQVPGKSTSWGSWRSPSSPYLRDASELILIMDKEFHKRTDKKGRNDISSKDFLFYTTNCWFMIPEVNRERHPAPFPLELPKRLILLYTWQDDIVLDPFCGSGTTCLAAKNLKRNFIGIDIDPKYVECAIRRTSQEILL